MWIHLPADLGYALSFILHNALQNNDIGDLSVCYKPKTLVAQRTIAGTLFSAAHVPLLRQDKKTRQQQQPK